MKENRIEELRRNKHMSQEELADKLGVSRQTVSEWERQLAYPSVEKLVRLGEIFDVSLDYLIKGKDFISADKEIKSDFLKRTKTANAAGSLIVGKDGGMLVSVPDDRDVGCSLVCAGSGMGKTVCYVLPNIDKAIENNESIVVTDPMGEIYEILREKLEKCGYSIRNINMNDLSGSDKFNLLSEITEKGELSPDMMKLSFNYLVGERDYIMFSIFLNLIRRGVTVSEICKMDSFSYVKNDLIETQILNACSNETINEKFIKLKINLNTFADSDLTEIVSGKDFHLSEIKNPKTIFFIQPSMSDRYGQNIAGLTLELLFMKILNKTIVPETKVNIFLDEYGVTFNSRDVLDKICRFRDNVKVSVLVQSLDQIRRNDTAVLNGFYNYIFMGSYNARDIETFSKFFKIPQESLEKMTDKLVYKRRGMDAIVLGKNSYYKA